MSNIRLRRSTLGRRRQEGAIGDVSVIVVSTVIGLLLGATLPTFMDELRSSKHEEVAITLEEIARGAAAYYERSHLRGELSVRRCLPAATDLTPAIPSPELRAAHFVTLTEKDGDERLVDEDSDTIESAESWDALGMTEVRNLRFSYAFEPLIDGCLSEAPEDDRAPLFVVVARGDLDGDGDLSTFEQAYSVEDGLPVARGILHVDRRSE